MTRTPTFRDDRIRVISWDDPGGRPPQGHDPRSAYVERYWLGVLGPATTLLLRRLAAELDRAPNGWWMDVEVTARSLGLVSKSRHSPFQRALGRMCTFGVATAMDPSMLAVRRRLPDLTGNQLARLPEALRAEHARLGHRAEVRGIADETAYELATTLLDLGEPLDEIDAQLARWQIDHRVRQQALYEAWQRRAA